MCRVHKFILLSMIAGICLLLINCATIHSISAAKRDSPKVYSGTRIDVHALNHDTRYLDSIYSRYGIRSPEYPGADLPFSFILDSFLFPLTSSVALYETVFD